MLEPGIDGRWRDENGEIREKRSDTLVRTLRETYGENFLSEFRGDAKLGTVLEKTGKESLTDLVKDHRS